tara:strand:- start:15058 stop:15702 length:645 start_codon:yes stop_codon:yes gene_type:complete
MEVAIQLRTYIFLTVLFLWTSLYGQYESNYDTSKSQFSIINGDTIPWLLLDDILVLNNPIFSGSEARRKYYALRQRVLKVYPYAKGMGERLDSLNLRLEKEPRYLKRKKMIRKYYKTLKDRFEPELHKLTVSEGQILCKLVYRETERTIFDIVKGYKNILSAVLWRITASWWDISIRKEYLPNSNKEDALIEKILLSAFANNYLEPGTYYYNSK